MEKNKKFGWGLLFGVFFLSLVFILTGCQGFLDDYSYSPVGPLQSSSNH